MTRTTTGLIGILVILGLLVPSLGFAQDAAEVEPSVDRESSSVETTRDAPRTDKSKRRGKKKKEEATDKEINELIKNP